MLAPAEPLRKVRRNGWGFGEKASAVLGELEPPTQSWPLGVAPSWKSQDRPGPLRHGRHRRPQASNPSGVDCAARTLEHHSDCAGSCERRTHDVARTVAPGGLAAPSLRDGAVAMRRGAGLAAFAYMAVTCSSQHRMVCGCVSCRPH
jgi:hypothetical protein